MLICRRMAFPVLCAVTAAALTCAHAARAIRPLTTAAAVQKLHDQQASGRIPVTLQGQVTFVDNEWKLAWIQDATAPVFVVLAKNSPLLRAGDLVALRGYTSPGQQGAFVVTVGVHVLDHRQLPQPRQVTVAALGRAISWYVELEGTLRPGSFIWNHTSCVLVDASGAAPIIIPGGVNPSMPRLIGALVRVRGVVSLQLDKQNHVIGHQLFVENFSDLQPVVPNWQPVSQSAPIPISNIPAPDTSRRTVPAVHIRGTVLWNGSNALVLKDSSAAIEVLPAVNPQAQAGAEADIVGFPSIRADVLTIADAEVQVIRPPIARPAAKTPLRIRDVLGRGHNGDQVILTGVVVSQKIEGKDDQFVLRDHGETAQVQVYAGDSDAKAFHIDPGSVLQAEGTLWIVRRRNGSPPSAVLLVDSLSNLTIRKPQAINWRWLLLGFAILAALAIFLWISQLRRAVSSQAALIRRQIEHEAMLETRYRALFERNLAAVFSWKPSGEITDCNPAFARMLGFNQPSEIIGSSYCSLLTDDSDRHAIETNSGNVSGFETSLTRADGSTVYLLENITAVGSGESVHYETTALDITESRRNRLELQRARDAAQREAERDALTGLPNRRRFTQVVQNQLKTASAVQLSTGMLYLDLDGFKGVNDTLGHLSGDLLLQEVANRFNACLLPGDTLYRIGGDEFAVLLTRPDSISNAASLAHRLLASLARPLVIAEREIVVGAGVGISFFPDPAPDFTTLLKQADSAMYQAKRTGHNQVAIYTREIGQAVLERNHIESELRIAVARHEISVHYQPQFNTISGQLVRFEALARLNSPVLGEVPPSRFIPIAEENGLIHELGTQVLAIACRDAVRWMRKTGHAIPVAVNVSSVQLRSDSFVDEVIHTIRASGLVPDLLELEVTESIMLHDLQRCREMLIRLKSHGIRLALDDFGTGYSSLAYLQDLPFDRLKIAPTFLAKFHRGRGGEGLIRAVLGIARSLDLSVVVEGVETAKDLELVRSIGVDEIQGFLVGKPEPDACLVIAAHAQNAGVAGIPSGDKTARRFATPLFRPDPS